jgi:CRISPR/Cas system-associated exonuclease Cas4 (RecB family)
VYDNIDRFGGQEVTVRCKVIGDAHPGDKGGEKLLYEVDDPSGNLGVQSVLSFWLEEPDGAMFDGLRGTEPYVRGALGDGDDRPTLPRGETVLVRGIPLVAGGRDEPQLYVNVTSVALRAPELYIGKSELRTAESCPRRYYLRYVKNVYGGRSSLKPYFFKGDAVHLALEHALDAHPERFVRGEWTEAQARAFANEVMDEELAIYQAKLALCGIGLDSKEHVTEIATRLFTDEEFCEHIRGSEQVETERPLSEQYGYNGRVDLVIDGTPYDLKTTYQLNHETREKHERQLRLYLFALLLESLEPGESFVELLADEPTGYLVYPNLEDSDSVKLVSVSLDRETAATLIDDRNEVAAIRGSFAPPSTYNRDCHDCNFREEQPVGDGSDVLPPACTFHCQNERRWPCYEFDEQRGVTSDCSLFEECTQRLEYRDPDVTDHYSALRSALQSERTARRTANELLDSVDRRLLTQSGRLIPGLQFCRVTELGVVYETETPVVPSFRPGDMVTLEPDREGAAGTTVPYLGQVDDGYLFGFAEVDPAFLDQEMEYVARNGFDPEIVSRRYLPYLDYAQRRESHPRFEHEDATGTEGPVGVETPHSVVEFLDRAEVFVDIPARTDREELLATVLEDLTSASYPQPNEDAVVPESGRRALVLCQTPDQVALAHEATGDEHYRMDGIASGPGAIHESLDREEIQSRLLSSRSIVSTVQYALSSQHFHEFTEGAFGNRDHSERFFDVLVLVGAQHVTEPVYLYLRELADRVVAIGDSRRSGLDMVSSEAVERALDRSYFEWAHDRYATAPVDGAVSLQFAGHGNEFVRTLFDEETFEPLDSSLSFFGFEGTETSSSDELVLRASIRARNGLGKQLTFDVTHTSANPFEVQEVFVEREYLDATALPESGSVLLGDQPMQLVTKEPIEAVENPTSHRVTLRAAPDGVPAFSETFLHNRPEAKIIAELATEYEPAVVVTPFEAQANELATRLSEAGVDAPVVLPDALEGSMADSAIVSFTADNEAGVLHPPLTEPKTLYELLTCAEDILLVGNEETLRSKDAIEYLVTELAGRYEYEQQPS